MERGYIKKGSSKGGQTLNANSGDPTEITIPDSRVVSVVFTFSRGARIAVADPGTEAGEGKTAITTGKDYFGPIPADFPIDYPVVEARKRGESLYVISDDGTAGTFSYAYVRGGEKTSAPRAS